MKRVILGFAITPAFLPCVFWFMGGYGAAINAAIFSYLGTILLGIPLFVWAAKRKNLSVSDAGFYGGLAGAICSVPFMVVVEFFLVALLVFGAIGAIHGLIFWAIAIHGNNEFKFS